MYFKTKNVHVYHRTMSMKCPVLSFIITVYVIMALNMLESQEEIVESLCDSFSSGSNTVGTFVQGSGKLIIFSFKMTSLGRSGSSMDIMAVVKNWTCSSILRFFKMMKTPCYSYSSAPTNGVAAYLENSVHRC